MKRPENLRAAKWVVAPTAPPQTHQELSHIHPILLQMLYNRGLIEPSDIQAFLEGHYLESTDPFLLPDMETAVSRIQHAIENDEMIVVYGDFDADGVTSTVLLIQALRGLGIARGQARPYIPDRFKEGYGLNTQALDKIKEMGAALVISVDCGIRSVNEVEHANSIGLDMIITDHHSIGPKMPPALAIINPKREDSTYPEEMLAGVGIAYKLAQALYQSMPDRVQAEVTDLLDLVAIGTVADLAPLLRENRQLVIEGLKVLNRLERPGLAALAKITSLKKGSLTSESIGFGIGPRINAAGRLTHAYSAAKLLSVSNSVMAQQLANDLNEINRQRQQLTADLSLKAAEMVDPDAPIIIAEDVSFQPGVVGLIASRLAERNYRPAIILEKGEAVSRGSCRSIPEFHITEALDQVEDILVKHGGHAQAAGLTIKNEDLDEFKRRMYEIATARLANVDPKPTVSIDAAINLDDVDWALLDILKQLEPTGYANPAPLFVSRNVDVVSHRAVGRDKSHLQMQLSGQDGGYAHKVFSSIAFGQGAWVNMLPQTVDIVYSISVNEWRGRKSLQLMIKDIQSSAGEQEAGSQK